MRESIDGASAFPLMAAVQLMCARLGVGVVKRLVPVDTLDMELFAELTEG